VTAIVNPHTGGMLPIVWDYTHPATGETVLNVEALCRKVLNRAASPASRPLEPADYDDALAFLLAEVIVIAEERWPPRRNRYPSLAGYLAIALPTALVDHWRSVHGRGGWKRVVDMSALERAVLDSGADEYDGSTSEPVDMRPEAFVEEFVIGRVGVLRPRRAGAAAATF
jgi:hypothetical protein